MDTRDRYRKKGLLAGTDEFPGCLEQELYLKSMREGNYTRVTLAGIRESHPHDVTITKNAPNYKGSH